MIARISTDLPISAQTAFELGQKPALFRRVVWPILHTFDELPNSISEGDEVSARIWFFGFIPAWRHHLQMVSVRPFEISSHEHGGPVKVWNHRLIFEPTSETSCRYTDEVEIKAGLMTLKVWLFAQLAYRHRQRRWRALARVLA